MYPNPYQERGALGLRLHTVNKRPDISWSVLLRQHVFLPGKREQLLPGGTIVKGKWWSSKLEVKVKRWMVSAKMVQRILILLLC